jgi:hypothetical protein
LKKKSYKKKNIRNKNLVREIFGQTKIAYIKKLISLIKPDYSKLNIKKSIEFQIITELKHFDKCENPESLSHVMSILKYYQNDENKGYKKIKLLSKELEDLKYFFKTLIKKFCSKLDFSVDDEEYIYKKLFMRYNSKYFKSVEKELTPEIKQKLSLVANIEYYCNKILSEIDHHKRIKVEAQDFKIKVQPKYEGNYFSPEFFELFVRMNIMKLDLHTEKYPSKVMLFKSSCNP